MKNAKKFVMASSFLALCLLTTSCSLLRSDYERTQEIKINGQWIENADFSSVMRDPDSNWWLDFNDPQLTNLIELGLKNSNELKIALKLLQKVALESDLTNTNLLPTSGASLGSRKSWAENNQKSSSSSADFNLSYEIDLFGKLQTERDIGKLSYEAQVYDYKSVKLSLTYNIAKNYWKLAYLNDALKFEQQNLQDYEKILNLVELKFKEGAISRYDHNRTKEDLLSSKNKIISYKEQILKTLVDLATLVSVDDEKELYFEDYSLEGKTVPKINPGIPADILENRPDLQSMEYKIKSSLASYDLTKLNFFPSITLTGSEGFSSKDLLSFFENPITTIAASLKLPFLNYSTLTLKRDISKIEYESTVLKYEDSLRSALLEVKYILHFLEGLEDQISYASEKISLAKMNDLDYELKYDNGAMSYNDFLANKLLLRQYVLNYYNLLQEQLTETADLYKALGGSQTK